MHAVVLTFPGHFFQTQLCVISMLRHYPEISRLSFVLDDVQAEPWHTYRTDFEQSMNIVADIPWDLTCTSEIPKIKDCVAGWWRQQLVKLTLDQIFPGTKWFVVDGDVIFQHRFHIEDKVPISRRHDADSRWSRMCERYVKDVLGTDLGTLCDNDQPIVTSPVPFRYLDSYLLSDLRHHVRSRFDNEFVDQHLIWFADQTIVADIDPPDQWVMSEWELIECFRRYVQGRILPFADIGSGYQIASVHTVQDSGCGVFVHSYQRDAEIQARWFRDRGLEISDEIWQKSLDWYDHREVRRLG